MRASAQGPSMSRSPDRLLALFDELVDLDAASRAARLGVLFGEDAALAEELSRMLAADDAAGVLDRGVMAVAPTVAGGIGLDAPRAPTGSAGRRIGAFVLERLLGRGGMGEVWLAAREEGGFRQQVALKLVKRGLDGEDLLRRFMRERRILAGLSHPGIARFIDGGVGEDGVPWYAMEYVEGETLVDHARGRALGVRERVALVAEVADAVAYAQNRLVVHRDLKPSNILVDPQGRVRLLDFGIAKLLDEAPDARATATGLRAMSPAYAAPEQILDEPVSAATDVYALGVVLYELLTGSLPHQRAGATLETLTERVRQESTERPSARLRGTDAATTTTLGAGTAQRFARQVAGELDLIVLAALRREPERRYPSAAALADDLRRWLDGRPVSAQADTAGYRARKFVARHRFAVGSASAVLLALVAGFGTALWQAGVAREQAARAEREAGESDQIATFLQSVLLEADPMRASDAGALTITEVTRLAAARVDRDLAGQPSAQADVLSTLAAAAWSANDEPMATELTQRAHAVASASPEVDAAAYANAMRVVAEGQLRAGDARSAEATLRAGLARLAPLLDPPEPRPRDLLAAARSNNGLGSALFMRDALAESAAAMALSAQQSAAALGDGAIEAGMAWFNVGILRWRLGEIDAAQDAIDRAVAIHAAALAADDPRQAIVMDMQAQLQAERGDGAAAERTWRRAIELLQGDDAVRRDRRIGLQESLAVHLSQSGRFAEARAVYAQFIDLPPDPGGESVSTQRRGAAHRQLGYMAMWEGDLATAWRELERAKALFTRARSGEGLFPLNAAADLALVRGLRGETDAALAELERLREPIVAIAGERSSDEMIRRHRVGEVLAVAGRDADARAAFESALAGAASQPWSDSAYADQARLWVALLAARAPDADPRHATTAVEDGIAAMLRRGYGWHPLVRRARQVMEAPAAADG
jgi:serine/threonine-protein kinase